jgi:hypothetical protein
MHFRARLGGMFVNVPSMRYLAVLVIGLLCLAPSPAMAYVGPGSGLSAIGAALALVGGVVLAIVGFIWYPVKRLLFRLKRRTQSSAKGVPADSSAS